MASSPATVLTSDEAGRRASPTHDAHPITSAPWSSLRTVTGPGSQLRKIATVHICPRLFKTTPVDFRVRELPLGYFCTVTPP